MELSLTDNDAQTPGGSWVGISALIVGALMVLSACGTVDYSVNRSYFSSATRTDNALGTINFRRSETGEPYAVGVYRITHGYSADAPLYTQDALRMNISASHTSDSGSFVGLRSRFEF